MMAARAERGADGIQRCPMPGIRGRVAVRALGTGNPGSQGGGRPAGRPGYLGALVTG
jgi:hypothetical protein